MELVPTSSLYYMAIAEYAFVTASEVKAHIDESSSTWDTIIESLIDQCTKYAMNYCGGRRFVVPSADETEYYDGDKMLFLKSYPVTSLTGLYYRSGDYNNPTWNLYNPATDYIIDEQKGIVEFIGRPSGTKYIKAVYKGGYASISAVPADVKLAVILAVAKEFNKRKSAGITNESIGGGSIAWNKDPEFLHLLDAYKRFL